MKVRFKRITQTSAFSSIHEEAEVEHFPHDAGPVPTLADLLTQVIKKVNENTESSQLRRPSKSVDEKTCVSSVSDHYLTFKNGDKVRRINEEKEEATLEVVNTQVKNHPLRYCTLVRHLKGPNQGIIEEIQTHDLVLVSSRV